MNYTLYVMYPFCNHFFYRYLFDITLNNNFVSKFNGIAINYKIENISWGLCYLHLII